MGRTRRISLGNLVYHVLNRGNGRARIFHSPADYEALEELLGKAEARFGMRILAYCFMPNHWHLVLWPRQDGDLQVFMHWLTLTHSHRWQAFRETVGTGHLYQARYRSFPVQTDEYLLAALRYVESNALRAGLVSRAEEWRWSSLWLRLRGGECGRVELSSWPIPQPENYLDLVNDCRTLAKYSALWKGSVIKGRPFGNEAWSCETAQLLGLQRTLRPRGRPRSGKKGTRYLFPTAPNPAGSGSRG